MNNTRARKAFVEGAGTGLLLFVIVGSGIAAERTTADPGVQLLLHAVAVGAGLTVLIGVLVWVSGAHLNPAVTIGFWSRRSVDAPTAITYIVSQMCGAFAGVGLASLVFGERLSATAAGPTTGGSIVGELVGTFFLVFAILTLVDQDRATWIAAIVGGWVTAMILATPSGGLLNPAVTLARTVTDTYTGVARSTALAFALAQLLAGLLAAVFSRQLKLAVELKGI